MKIIIAPQAFKGSISAMNAAKAIEQGVKAVLPDATTILIPIADGGDGTLETLIDVMGGDVITEKVTGPLGSKVKANWGALSDQKTAIVEMASTSGLTLLKPNELDPYKATTYGLGEIICKALDKGYREFIVGIGGSATNDGGAGLAQALGIKLLNSNGKNIELGGFNLKHLDTIDISRIDPRISESKFHVACDVSNPMCGPEGASAVYGPQKGASKEMVAVLDSALQHFSHVVHRDLNKEIKHMPGAGAAGGLGGGMVAFLNASLKKGIDIVLDTIDFDQKLEGTDLVITGEGQMDFQTVFSKAPIGAAQASKLRNIPVLSLSGSLGKDYGLVHDHGIDAVFSILNSPMTLEEASDKSHELITKATEEIIRTLIVGTRL
ncbi:MAG: glycerate kinase [SAR202 cluster bacterium]|nr:glycerate kinase [SAR202 cluster bacterium]|tara:strand:+ start:16413 stop:17552 length:1140 start_codon:yes stop_codon:yes gene_type:complete